MFLQLCIGENNHLRTDNCFRKFKNTKNQYYTKIVYVLNKIFPESLILFRIQLK